VTPRSVHEASERTFPQTIAIVNQKGGVGKTSLAMNLVSLFKEAGRLPMVVDADPQMSAARWAASFTGAGGIVVRCLDAERDIELVSGEMKRLAIENGSDLLVLDCPADLREAAEVALLLADLIVIPVTPSPLDIWAAESTVSLARKARHLRGDGRPRIVLVPNRLNRATAMARDLAPTLAALGEEVAPGVAERVVLAESAILGQTVSQYSPKSRACAELGTLSRFILERLDV
jgi:chromosome partitioning protein